MNRKNDKEPADSTPADEEPSAQTAFASYAAPLVDHAIEYANAVREDPSPEDFHQLRVSLRRLRSLWWAFQPLLEEGENTRQRALYKYLATAAGKTRDWDILIALLAQESGIARGLTPTLENARGDALATSRETLSNADVKHLLREALSSATRELNTAHERVPLGKFANQRVAASERTLKKRMKRARHAKRSNYTAFHDVRKAGKKLRYLLEFFGPVLKGGRKRTVKRLKQIQKRFGTLNDIVASEMLLRDNAALLASSGDTDAVLQWLKKERKRRMRSAAGLLRTL
ncbi:CHAD domain-containing protein [Paraburkholderia terricola]|uniref:CHAD domain-containing protein n=1 Tax=Paraburkholderia terricola TaxID=169427 RepID=A0A1M6SQU2_9BURK|nr:MULTISPECIES: CHAD domain-containing protein [Paraburkholderia]SDO63881.1 CHAD domain-containing protein [Paraburkholderia sediminicola]SHK47009.1 CHAD domain-containing protein [Paraburkholderia terricola]